MTILDVNIEQKAICKKYGSATESCKQDDKLAISKYIMSGLMPINGLRHSVEGSVTGWYIWVGNQELDNDIRKWDIVYVKHLDHLGKIGELIRKYISLAPGWRFQIDDKGYEDVWEDKSLLEI